ncbi:ATP-binding protein [Mitsuaria sp. GD03876]|uniref:ATP-binding protein n=1 Tax=Mitsuaria sp. GD03876 TaxID=2975399 RepID=UPI00244AACF1|nr:ATP-binding protein [Mitsuaria sp. GD03876]MDH0863570.1 ATP-binding protein [Mitsuaria sp. GD03876]
MSIFHRTELAKELTSLILHDSPILASSPGLFLAARRRTGKSTFLTSDLQPELERQGAVVLHADLWGNRFTDPADVITKVIRAAIEPYNSAMLRLARSAGLEKVSVAGFSFALDQIGADDGVSISDALAALSDDCQRKIVLILDEAQQCITTERGNNTLFALKAARDRLNLRHHGLRVVATGSSRDKLSMLCDAHSQAFFGAPMMDFPTLDRDYVAWVCRQLPPVLAADVDEVMALFQRTGCRPEWLGAAAKVVHARPELSAPELKALFTQAVESRIQTRNHGLLKVVRTLRPLQSVVLRVLVTQGHDYAPYMPATMTLYRTVLDHIGAASDLPIDEDGVQATLDSLKDLGLLWRSAHGVYALEESGLRELLEDCGLTSIPEVPSERRLLAEA